MGQGGFQEVEQMNLFKDMVCYQEEVRDPSRMAEVLNRVIEKAVRGSAPAQINVPRDYWTQVIDIDLPPIVRFERQGGGQDAINKASKLLSEFQFPSDFIWSWCCNWWMQLMTKETSRKIRCTCL